MNDPTSFADSYLYAVDLSLSHFNHYFLILTKQQSSVLDVTGCSYVTQSETRGWRFVRIRAQYWNRCKKRNWILLVPLWDLNREAQGFECESVCLGGWMVPVNPSSCCASSGLLLLMIGVIATLLPQLWARPTDFWCNCQARKSMERRIEGMQTDVVRNRNGKKKNPLSEKSECHPGGKNLCTSFMWSGALRGFWHTVLSCASPVCLGAHSRMGK